MIGAILFLVIVVAGITAYCKVKLQNQLMAKALSEPDPVARQLKTEKAIQFAKTKNPYVRMQLRQAIEA